MKQTLFLIALAVGLLLFAGGYTPDHGNRIMGKSAPALMVADADSIVAHEHLHGNYVLACFWAGTDAASRAQLNEYTAWCRAHANEPLRVIGINSDKSTGLYGEIVRLDSLIAPDNFHLGADTADLVARNYGLQHGYGAVLISPQGKIVAFNPQPAKLADYLGSRDVTNLAVK